MDVGTLLPLFVRPFAFLGFEGDQVELIMGGQEAGSSAEWQQPLRPNAVSSARIIGCDGLAQKQASSGFLCTSPYEKVHHNTLM